MTCCEGGDQSSLQTFRNLNNANMETNAGAIRPQIVNMMNMSVIQDRQLTAESPLHNNQLQHQQTNSTSQTTGVQMLTAGIQQYSQFIYIQINIECIEYCFSETNQNKNSCKFSATSSRQS